MLLPGVGGSEREEEVEGEDEVGQERVEVRESKRGEEEDFPKCCGEVGGEGVGEEGRGGGGARGGGRERRRW